MPTMENWQWNGSFLPNITAMAYADQTAPGWIQRFFEMQNNLTYIPAEVMFRSICYDDINEYTSGNFVASCGT